MEIETSKYHETIDITERVEKEVQELLEKEKKLVCNKKSRACFIFCPHTTCGILVNEGSREVSSDLIDAIDEIEPKLDYLHKSNAQAHIKSALTGVSIVLPIKDMKLDLGEWQRVLFFEFDGPRKRKIKVEII